MHFILYIVQIVSIIIFLRPLTRVNSDEFNFEILFILMVIEVCHFWTIKKMFLAHIKTNIQYILLSFLTKRFSNIFCQK